MNSGRKNTVLGEDLESDFLNTTLPGIAHRFANRRHMITDLFNKPRVSPGT